MEAKDRVYQALCRMSKSDCQITAAALAEELNLSRQVVSHYLNRLCRGSSRGWKVLNRLYKLKRR